jgi:hypothetical protein
MPGRRTISLTGATGQTKVARDWQLAGFHRHLSGRLLSPAQAFTLKAFDFYRFLRLIKFKIN